MLSIFDDCKCTFMQIVNVSAVLATINILEEEEEEEALWSGSKMQLFHYSETKGC